MLNKETAETLTESTVDGWLFGTDLTERIKAAKLSRNLSMLARPRYIGTPIRAGVL